MSGGRPPGFRSANDDEEENSADSVEQAALEASRQDESLLDPDSLMFEEIEDRRKDDEDEEDEEEEAMARGVETDTRVPDRLGDEIESYPTTPYGSPLSDISAYTHNQKWIGEVKQMLLDDQQKSQNRAKEWASQEVDPISPLSPIGGMEMESLEGGWRDSIDDALPEIGFEMPSAEELAEKYSNELIEKDLDILEKERRISALEKAKRELENSLEDCQKELKQKTETATSGVEKLKKTLEEKDKCIMETSERLRKVTESYNSSEKRWKEQQGFLEKQIEKLKTDLEGKANIDEELERLTEQSRHEKEVLERKLEDAKAEMELQKKKFSEEKEVLEIEIQELEYEKTALENLLRDEIERLQDKLTVSEHAVESAVNEKESIRAELELQEEKNRTLNEDIAKLKSKEEVITRQEQEKQNLEQVISELKEKLEESESKYDALLTRHEDDKKIYNSAVKEAQEELEKKSRELELEKESHQQEIEEVKERVEVEEAPVNFFTQGGQQPAEDPWAEKQKALEDRIAELELEKGNLLLQLVDVDEREQQDEQKRVAATALAEENEKKLEILEQALEVAQGKNVSLERELEETKSKESSRIETAMSTIAWEEKYEELQKANQALKEELDAQRALSSESFDRCVELQRKLSDAELAKPSLEGIVEIDKCDGWSDGSPQLPDEGFNEMEAQIAELKATLEEKTRQIEDLIQAQKDTGDRLMERNVLVSQYESRIEEFNAENLDLNEKLEESTKELDRLRQELLEKAQQPIQETEVNDGWTDDTPDFFNDGIKDSQASELQKELELKAEELRQLQASTDELKRQLASRTEELSTVADKSKGIEDKLKKALKALKQKNEKISELKKRLDEDAMSTSSASCMESSMVVEPVLTKSSAYETTSSPTIHLELDRLRQDNETKDVKIRELSEILEVLAQQKEENKAHAATAPVIDPRLEERDLEINSLRSELSQMAATLNSKDVEVTQLMSACEEMQKSIDEKVELLNECVGKKDVEVRQAISQYEDLLKDATLNVSQLTKELEEKIRIINGLQGELLEAQEELYSTQNDFERYKDSTSAKLKSLREREQEHIQHEQEHIQRQQAALQSGEDLGRVKAELEESIRNQTMLGGLLEQESNARLKLEEEIGLVHADYETKTKDLQLQVSQLIDQLNEKDTAISVMEVRLKESDEALEKSVKEVRDQLEEKAKLLEQTEQSLFVKNEECVRIEERLKEAEETHRKKIEEHVNLIQQHEAYQGSITAQLEQLRTVEAQLRDVVNQQQEQYNNLYYQYSQGSQEYTTLTEAKKEIETTLESLRKDNDELSENVVTLKDKLDQVTKELEGRDAVHAAQIQKMQEECRTLSESIQIGQADVAHKDQELKNLQTILVEYETKLQSAAMAQGDWGQKVDELKEQLSRAEAELESVREVHAKCNEDYSTLELEANDFKRKLADSNNELNQCRAQLEEFDNLRTNLPEYLQRVDVLLQVLNNRQTGETLSANSLVDALNSASILGTSDPWDTDYVTPQLQALPTRYEIMERISKLADVLQNELHLSTETEKVRSLQSQVQDLKRQLEMASDPQETDILKAQVVSLTRSLEIAPDAQQFAILQTEVQQLRNQLDAAINPDSFKVLEKDVEEKNREISDLRFELEEGIIQEKRLKENLESRENEIKQLRQELQEKEEQINELWTQAHTIPEAAPAIQDSDSVKPEEFTSEKELAYQRKIDLLQNKLQEVEESEVRCYEDYNKSKIHRTELEMDNLRMSAELEQIRRSIQNGDNDPRYRAMENQLVLMTKTLEDRDNLCKEMLKNVKDLQANLDALQIRMNSMSAPPSLEVPPESLQAKCIEKDREIFSLEVDLRRERKIRELYEGQLFLATSKKQFENSTRKSTSTGSWFGLGELFSSPQPSRPLPSPNSRSTSSVSVPPPSPSPEMLQSYGRPITPVTPMASSSSPYPSVFESSGLAGSGQQYFVPQLSPNPAMPPPSDGWNQTAQQPIPTLPYGQNQPYQP